MTSCLLVYHIVTDNRCYKSYYAPDTWWCVSVKTAPSWKKNCVWLYGTLWAIKKLHSGVALWWLLFFGLKKQKHIAGNLLFLSAFHQTSPFYIASCVQDFTSIWHQVFDWLIGKKSKGNLLVVQLHKYDAGVVDSLVSVFCSMIKDKNLLCNVTSCFYVWIKTSDRAWLTRTRYS